MTERLSEQASLRASEAIVNFERASLRASEAIVNFEREVLGDAHVDRATAAAGIDADFQRWLTGAAWGGLWARDQLDRRTRSCITIAVLTALRAEHELRLHIPAGRRNGLTDVEIAEVIMHTAGYAGIPAANAAMAIAKELLADEA